MELPGNGDVLVNLGKPLKTALNRKVTKRPRSPQVRTWGLNGEKSEPGDPFFPLDVEQSQKVMNDECLLFNHTLLSVTDGRGRE